MPHHQPATAQILSTATPPKSRPENPRSIMALRIIELASAEEVDLQAIAHMASSDPGFAMRVLSTVNSPLFALRNRVDSVQHAVTLLGARGLRNVAFGLMLRDMMPPGDLGRMLMAQSLRRATAAKLIAQALGKRDTDTYSTIGLLLESGLLLRAREEPEKSLEAARIPAHHRVVWERADGDRGHPKRGADFARSFGLPDPMVRAILLHHSGAVPSGETESIAWGAEQVAAVFEGGEIERVISRARRALGELGLEATAVNDILDQVPQITTEAAAMLDCKVDPQHGCDTLREEAYERLLHTVEEYETLVRSLERVLEQKELLSQELEQARDQLLILSHTDPLTGLANRRAFMTALRRDLSQAQRSGHALSLVMVDIDHFKQFNDRYGHPAGDAVLQHVASCLQAQLRGGDLVARLGGEEFAVILPGCRSDEATTPAERLRQSLHDSSHIHENQPLRVTASFGVATLTAPQSNDNEVIDALMAAADVALYQAKREGRDRVVVHSEAV